MTTRTTLDTLRAMTTLPVSIIDTRNPISDHPPVTGPEVRIEDASTTFRAVLFGQDGTDPYFGQEATYPFVVDIAEARSAKRAMEMILDLHPEIAA